MAPPSAAMRRYAVLGVGAVGGYYGARLADAGHPVHFVARSDAGHIRRHGLRVDSPTGAILLEDVSVHESPTTVPPVDVVLVCLKTTDNAALAGLLPPLLGPDTAVVLLQNGLGIEDTVVPLTGSRPLLGGLCFLCSNKVGPGWVRHLDYGRISLGQHDAAGITPTVEAVAGDITGSGVEVVPEPDLVTARWKKLVWNVPFNGLSVALDALPQELLASPDGRSAVLGLMREVQAGARACGKDIPDSFLDRMVVDTEAMAPYLTSMKLDFDGNRPLEVDAILRAPARASAAAGTPLPRIEALADHVAFLAGRR